jgi:hypothetical protein
LIRTEAKTKTQPQIAWPTAPEPSSTISKKTWIWIALATVAAGAAYAIHAEQSRDTKTVVQPVQRDGG